MDTETNAIEEAKLILTELKEQIIKEKLENRKLMR